MTLPADDERYTYSDVSTEPFSGRADLVRGNYWGTSVSYRYGSGEVTVNVYHVDYDAPSGAHITHHDLDGLVFDSYRDETYEVAREKNMNDAYRTLYNAGLMFYMRRR